MKTKFGLFFSLVALSACAQTNAVHNWTLKSGAVIPGDYFTSGMECVKFIGFEVEAEKEQG
jgi:hypothetical protein